MVLGSSFLFLKSSLDSGNSYNTEAEILDWINKQNEEVSMEIEKIPFSKLENWEFRHGKLQHKSGKFFSVEGIDVVTNYGVPRHWQQPIINQPEIGYLGFLTKEIKGILHFLVQAKIEPGNINKVQLSPTLQATKSNYSLIHKGSVPKYIEYFEKATSEQVLLDQLQSEHSSRFLKKRNRNIIIKIKEDIEVLNNFAWLTLYQIKSLMRRDNLVNMNTRSVISGIPLCASLKENRVIKDKLEQDKGYGLFSKYLIASILTPEGHYNSMNAIFHYITAKKSRLEVDIKKIPLKAMENWRIEDDAIKHRESRFFKIIATRVRIGNREVSSWTQPLIEPKAIGICAFLCKILNGSIHFAVQFKVECGSFDLAEFGPTVQYSSLEHGQNDNFLQYILNSKKKNIIFDTLQSEEGGRFFKEQHRNMLVFTDQDFPNELPDNYLWMSFYQIQYFLKFNNYFNIQARSLIASLSLG